MTYCEDMVRQKSWRDDETGPERALGRAIRRVRTDREMSRKELAERTGISYAYLTEIEGGKKVPSQRVMAAIAEALGVRQHEFMLLAEELAGASVAYSMAPPDFDADPMRPSRRYFHARDRGAVANLELEPDSRRADLKIALTRIADALDVDDLERLVELARRFGAR